jgi:hypothetical protein
MFWMKPDLDSGTAVPPAALLPEVVCVQAVLDQRHKECVRGQRHGGHGIPPSNLPGEFSWRRCCPILSLSSHLHGEALGVAQGRRCKEVKRLAAPQQL